MKTTVKAVILSVLAMLAFSALPSDAAKTFESRVVKQLGDNTYLIESGIKGGNKGFCPNEIVPVYRKVDFGRPIKGMQSVNTINEVGDIKVLSYVGDRDFRAQVVSGSVQVGDTAKKVGVYCAGLSGR